MSIKGINTRLSLALLLLILVTVGSLGGYLLWRTHDHTLQLLTNSLTLQALTTRQYVEKDLPIPAQYPKLQDEAQRLSAATGLRITLVLANGTVIADSWERPETLDNHSNRPEVSGALEGHPAQTSRYSDTLHENLLYVAGTCFTRWPHHRCRAYRRYTSQHRGHVPTAANRHALGIAAYFVAGRFGGHTPS